MRLQAEDYKDGGEGVGYSDSDVGNTGGGYRADDVDMEAAVDDGDGFNVGWTQPGEWVILTTDTDPGPWITDPTFAGGDYYVNYRVASDPGGGGFGIEIDGTRVDTIGPIASTGGWQTWTTVSNGDPWFPPPVAIGAGSHEVKLLWDGSNVNVNWLELTTDAPASTPQRPLAFTPPQGSTGTWGVREVTNAGKGVSDVLAKAQLTKGTHDIRVLYWEGGGGAAVEVMAAQGAKDDVDGDFRLIGHKSTGSYGVPGIFVASVTVGSEPNGPNEIVNLAQAAGFYKLEAIMFERGGGAGLEIFGRNSASLFGEFKFDYELLTSTSARIVQDVDGLQLVPEPSTLAMLLGIAAMGLLIRRRK